MGNHTATLAYNTSDYITSTSVFSGINKTIISKDFKGGKISTLFGATELDFSHSDIRGIAVLDISQAFSETKITVPSDWRVETDITQLFATVGDQRDTAGQKNSAKILILTGTSVFATVEIISV